MQLEVIQLFVGLFVLAGFRLDSETGKKRDAALGAVGSIPSTA